MFSKVLLSVAVILLVSAPAFAQPPIGAAAGSIYQYQNFIVGDVWGFDSGGLSSILTVSHGESAFGLNSLVIENEQAAPVSFKPPWCTPVPPSPCNPCQTKAYQWQWADMKQKTDAVSDCGIIVVSAFLTGFGEQTQAIGSSDNPKTQGQTLGVAADQMLLSTGNADGWAVNTADNVSQAQVARNGAGSMGEYSFIDASQRSEVHGTPNTTVSALNSLVATTTQTQTVF